MDGGKDRLFGITVLADFVLNEGVDGILDNITERAGANAIAVNPIVTAEAAKGEGSWQPPADAGSSPRVFDRPLWGKTSLWVRSGPSYHPNTLLYSGSLYQPKKPNDLTERHGELVGEFIDAALERDLRVYFQVPSVTPSGLRDEDRPRLPNGDLPDRMADTGSLASPAIRSYTHAFVNDILEKYPNVTGFRPDWPEYPCYKLSEAFQDFSGHVAVWAKARGFDYHGIHKDVGRFYSYLHGELTNRDFEEFADVERGKWAQTRLLRQFPNVYGWLLLKRALSIDLLTFWRETITNAAGNEKELSANAFMPPLTMWTGMDLSAAANICDAVSPKLYTMHWSAMVEFWGRVLLDNNIGLDESLVVRALVNLFDIEDQATASKISDYGYPLPDEPHPIPNRPQERRIKQALSEVRGKADTTFLMHGYGPPADFARRFKLVADSEADGVWINRYGYLSDEKLDTVGGIWKDAESRK